MWVSVVMLLAGAAEVLVDLERLIAAVKGEGTSESRFAKALATLNGAGKGDATHTYQCVTVASAFFRVLFPRELVVKGFTKSLSRRLGDRSCGVPAPEADYGEVAQPGFFG